MNKYLLAVFIIAFISLLGCSQPPEKQVIGAWKAAEKNTFIGRTWTFVFTDKTMDEGTGSGPEAITLLAKDNKVFVQRAKTNNIIGTLELLNKNTMLFSVPLWGTIKLVRTTEEDIQTIKTEERRR